MFAFLGFDLDSGVNRKHYLTDLALVGLNIGTIAYSLGSLALVVLNLKNHTSEPYTL